MLLNNLRFYILAAMILAGMIAITSAGTASAHVTVRPAETVTAGFQTFTVSAPNEKDIPFTSVRLDMPTGLKHVTLTVKPGWQISTTTEGSDQNIIVKSITWTGSGVPGGHREEFSFSAQAPAEATDLQWKAFQTYGDGTTVAWNLTESQQPKQADGSPDFSKSGPFSVTKVVKETESVASMKRVEQAAAGADKSADRALYVGIAGLVVGLTGIALATRRR